MVRVSYQGGLDGLCGMYAIVNAICGACGIDDEETFFQAACKGLSQRRWPEVLWGGTTFGDMQRMFRAIQDAVDDGSLSVTYPFSKNPPASNADYWKRFDDLFDEPEVRCAVLGAVKPDMHWIVAGPDGGRVQFMDSTAGRPFLRLNRSSLHAGKRLIGGAKWLLEPTEVILFRKD